VWGQRRTTSRSSRPISVHPHACGDNCAPTRLLARLNGSPPRVWGQLPAVARAGEVRRFTPTRVGTTAPVRHRPVGCSVHPHACGDNAARVRRSLGRAGSPPRVWGQRLGRSARHRELRFTPTRVGTTPSG